MRIRSFLFAVACAACGGAPHPARLDAPVAVDRPRALDLKPLGLELRAVSVRGTLEVLTATGWQPLGEGMNASGVAELRASWRGAVVSIGHGDAAGRLWLRAGSRVRIGQAPDGIHVSMIQGRARVKRAGANLSLSIDAASGPIAITGDYVMDAARGGTAITPTAARPELAAFAIALDQPEQGVGVGTMEAHGDDGRSEALQLKTVHVKVTTRGDTALTEVEHVFYNPAGGRPREGKFRFPVPDGAMLVGMAMEIDGKLVEGEIVEREKAREVYDEVVDKMEDPALLEWEEGNWFGLRVFPIPAQGEKRVVIRYVTPLVQGGDGWEYDYGLAIANAGAAGNAPGAIGDFTIEVDGKEVAHETQLARGMDVSVPIAPDRVPIAIKETRSDGEYTAVRIAPDLAKLAAPAHGPRNVAIVFDTSRSSLEGRALAEQMLAATLGELGPSDSFVVLASDVTITPSSKELAPATDDAKTAAASFIHAIEPDGASDMSLALGAAAALRPTEVVYIGDGIPTWGEQSPELLGKAADAIGAPIYAALVGKGTTTTLWGELAGRSGGRAMVVKSADDAARFALVDAHAGEIPRLAAARITVDDPDAIVFPQQATTIYAGDELVALIKSSKAPQQITLRGIENGKEIVQTIPIKNAVVEPGVAQRWGREQIESMEAQGADRDAIVAVSRDLDVLSRYTSLLVLENDEAYKAHQIERKHASEDQLAQGAPQVTGGDLDTLGARRASLSPDEIQPGDPEIKIPAARDARSVVVAFPFGETKLAVWDDEVDAWMVRFLIDKDTPDGLYQARVTITNADGSVRVLSLPYTVDTAAPDITIEAEKIAGGYRIVAKQTGARRKDADRVEVVLPDGSILALTQTARGRFEGEWRTAPTAATLRVVVRDHALNQATTELVIR
ncbi:MAG TPA: VIT and VWA domain-containing protein [Kofleriaceae bacterium]|nr:VIT and VWA domain-containing protein [Kofleriaceae bacterium]